MKTEQPGFALNDAKKAISVNPNYIKGYYRRGAAHLLLCKYPKAVKDFELVVKLFPKDQDAKNKLKQAREFAMSEAIRKDDDAEVVLSSDDINVPESYTGPRLDDDKISFEFIDKLSE